jgi:hypothetical protein
LTSLHYPSENIDVVLNRASRKNTLTERDVESSLHREISVRVPNNYSQVVTAINAGMPLGMDHRSDLPMIFDQWADLIAGHEAAAAASASGGTNSKGSRHKLLSLFGS